MTRKAQTQAATMVVLAAVLLLIAGQKLNWWSGGLASVSSGERHVRQLQPQETIYRMFAAAKQGDIEGYLACYSGQIGDHLQRVRDEMTPARFADYLKQRNREVKGFAVAEPEALSGQEVGIMVESVYQGRNESQRYYLQKHAGDWKITRVDEAERVETVVPYGTPAY